jgi:acyl-CoA-dependent ceramide synthase
MYTSDYWLNLKEMWTNFPSRTMTSSMKWYYLVQFAFWLQQLFVVHIEEKRSDHWQMFTHHIFTSALMFFSYGFYQTKVGNVILCVMDVVDLLLPVRPLFAHLIRINSNNSQSAKMFKYLNLRTLCDVTFGIFITVWFFARHLSYLAVCWSIWADVPTVMPYGCFNSITGEKVSDDGGSSVWVNILQPFERPGGVVCFNNRIRMSFLSLLAGLQVLTMIWFGMILRVAYGVLSGKGAEDVRSDDEDEEEIEEEEVEVEIPSFENSVGENAKAHPIEEEVDAESLNHANGNGKKRSQNGSPVVRRSSRRTARATAISIPGHGDHKELLGRIGCDKPS